MFLGLYVWELFTVFCFFFIFLFHDSSSFEHEKECKVRETREWVRGNKAVQSLSQIWRAEIKKKIILDEVAPCKRELNELIGKKKVEFAQKSRGKLGVILSERMNSISGFKPKGVLVAHLVSILWNFLFITDAAAK